LLSDSGNAAWLRQKSGKGNVIMHIAGSSGAGTTVEQPIFWLFDGKGMLQQRVSGGSAQLVDGVWHVSAVTSVDKSGAPQTLDSLDIPTSLSAAQVSSGLASPETVPFWSLPTAISQARSASLPPYRFILQFHALLSRPFLLASMVLIAASVGLGHARAGGTGRMILSGVIAGFVLYVVTEIARNLGNEGLVPPPLAAWAPAVVAILLGATVLLFREDG